MNVMKIYFAKDTKLYARKLKKKTKKNIFLLVNHLMIAELYLGHQAKGNSFVNLEFPYKVNSLFAERYRTTFIQLYPPTCPDFFTFPRTVVTRIGNFIDRPVTQLQCVARMVSIFNKKFPLGIEGTVVDRQF